ncbi:MAG: DUF2892 domain-containing protein [Methanobacteriota archaeon]
MKIGEKNVGKSDQIIRILLGIILLIVSVMGYVGTPWSYLLVIIAIIALLTGIIGTCPLYSLLGLNTRK